MRLVNTVTLNLEEFEGRNVPPYAILSHRWRQGEVLYSDMTPGNNESSKAGWYKIRNCCQQAQRDGLSYVWIDTCCIDKSSSAELTEAINSMFKWYEESTVCYAYLSDVSTSTRDGTKTQSLETNGVHRHLSHNFLTEFYEDLWFTRGWTLQELLAPKHIVFYNHDWEDLGNKYELCDALTCITAIPSDILLHERKLNSCPVAQRMSWASKRSTTRVEDLAYSLLGIFDVNMPLLYGERESAFVRLQEEILRRSNDESILLWQADDLSLLARSPSAFAMHLPNIPDRTMYAAESSKRRPLDVELRCRYRKERHPCTLTNVGLSITLLLVPWYIDVYLVKLQVEKRVQTGNRVQYFDACVFLRQTVNDSRLARVRVGNEATRWIESVGGKSLSNAFLQSTGTIPRPIVIAHESWDTSAGEGYLDSWDPKTQRYGFRFNFQQHASWGTTKTLEADNIISRYNWNPQDRTLQLEPGGFEVLAVFRILGAERWRYMYFGFTPDFIPTFVQKDWHFQTSFKAFNEYRNTYPMRQDLSEALSYSHFWESIKRADPEQELVIQGSQNPYDVVRAPTDIDGLSLMITRWTSGYVFDFIKTENRKRLIVPRKTINDVEALTQTSISSATSGVFESVKTTRNSMSNNVSEVDDIINTGHNVSDKEAEVQSIQPDQDIKTGDDFHEIELFVVTPSGQDASRPIKDNPEHHVDRDKQQTPIRDMNSPQLLLNDEEVDFDFE